MDEWLANEQVKYDHEPSNSEEMTKSRVGERLYKLIFEPYTFKQWAKYPKELGPEVTARIPVRNDHDDRYFPNDLYQALPTDGYTSMFENMTLYNPLIDVVTDTDYFQVKDKLKCSTTFYTGPIDAYFSNLGWPKLEYRSLDFERKVAESKFFQTNSVINHPSPDNDYTRIVEYKHLPNQPSTAVASPNTVYFIERSKDGGEPYYPVPNQENKDLYKKYQQMAEKEENGETKVFFVGRLANYKYFNMDQAILNALELFDRFASSSMNSMDTISNDNSTELTHKLSEGRDGYVNKTLEENETIITPTIHTNYSSIAGEEGLKIAYVTYSYLANFTHFDQTVLAAIKTWLPAHEKYYVVLNQNWKEAFEIYKQERMELFGKYIDRIEPIFVDCPEAKFGESPCCKQQEGLIEFYNKYFFRDSNECNKHKKCHYDWVVYMDDDMYFQHGVFASLIEATPYGVRDKTEYLSNKNQTNPILVTADNLNVKRLGMAGYLRGRSPYKCSKDPQYMYPWGQPAIYNKASLELVLPGLKAKGLVKQCMEFGVTHDVGNAIFHWMYSIPSVGLRTINLYGQRKRIPKIRDDYVAVHKAGIKFTMEAIHEKRNPLGVLHFNFDKLPPREYFGWWNATGFKRTETYRKFGDPSEWGDEEWHTMNVSDCAPTI